MHCYRYCKLYSDDRIQHASRSGCISLHRLIDTVSELNNDKVCLYINTNSVLYIIITTVHVTLDSTPYEVCLHHKFVYTNVRFVRTLRSVTRWNHCNPSDNLRDFPQFDRFHFTNNPSKFAFLICRYLQYGRNRQTLPYLLKFSWIEGHSD